MGRLTLGMLLRRSNGIEQVAWHAQPLCHRLGSLCLLLRGAGLLTVLQLAHNSLQHLRRGALLLCAWSGRCLCAVALWAPDSWLTTACFSISCTLRGWCSQAQLAIQSCCIHAAAD